YAAAGLSALLPIIHIVLLEGTGGAKAPDPGQAHGLFDLGRRGLVGINPRRHDNLVGSMWVPDAEGTGRGAEDGEVRKHRPQNWVDQVDAGPQTSLDFRANALFIGKDFGHRRVADIMGTKGDDAVTVARREHRAGGRGF